MMQLKAFTFHYAKQEGRDEQGNTVVSYYPMIPSVFEWKGNKSYEHEALVDSGSDGNVIPKFLADRLKLDIEDHRPMRVVGYNRVERWKANVNLTLGRGGNYVDLSTVEVTIPKTGDSPVILGRKPLFELYDITFKEAIRKTYFVPHR